MNYKIEEEKGRAKEYRDEIMKELEHERGLRTKVEEELESIKEDFMKNELNYTKKIQELENKLYKHEQET